MPKGPFSYPLIKFIGDRDMVIPILGNGYLLSHKDYLNHYYPEIIRLIDGNGIHYQYQTATLLKSMNWWKSIQYVNLLYHIQPNLIHEPSKISLEGFKQMVSLGVEKTAKSRSISLVEKREIILSVQQTSSHAAAINVIASVGHWK